MTAGGPRGHTHHLHFLLVIAVLRHGGVVAEDVESVPAGAQWTASESLSMQHVFAGLHKAAACEIYHTYKELCKSHEWGMHGWPVMD